MCFLHPLENIGGSDDDIQELNRHQSLVLQLLSVLHTAPKHGIKHMCLGGEQKAASHEKFHAAPS